MIFIRIVLLITALAFALQAQAVVNPPSPEKKALLVYDENDTTSRIYLETYRKQLAKTGIGFDEAAIAKADTPDVSKYEYLLIYSRVMAFNMVSPVRTWVRSLKTLTDKKVFIFATANRFFNKGNLKDMVDLVTKRNGVIVDAVSSATSKLSNEQKAKSVEIHLAKLIK